MANVVVTVKLMPSSPEVDLAKVEEEAKKMITDFAGETETKTEEEPIAFGLKALNVIFVLDEAKGSTDELEKNLSEIENVESVQVTDVRRAVG